MEPKNAEQKLNFGEAKLDLESNTKAMFRFQKSTPCIILVLLATFSRSYRASAPFYFTVYHQLPQVCCGYTIFFISSMVDSFLKPQFQQQLETSTIISFSSNTQSPYVKMANTTMTSGLNATTASTCFHSAPNSTLADCERAFLISQYTEHSALILTTVRSPPCPS